MPALEVSFHIFFTDQHWPLRTLFERPNTLLLLDQKGRNAVVKEILPGLSLLIGMCVASAVLQTLSVIEPDKLMAGQLAAKMCSCDRDPCRLVIRPTR